MPCTKPVRHFLGIVQIRALAFLRRVRYQRTMNMPNIDELARKLAASVPEGLQSMREDLETNFRGVLSSGLAKLDLVTREEFDVQTEVLARTREKLEALEKKLQTMQK